MRAPARGDTEPMSYRRLLRHDDAMSALPNVFPVAVFRKTCVGRRFSPYNSVSRVSNTPATAGRGASGARDHRRRRLPVTFGRGDDVAGHAALGDRVGFGIAHLAADARRGGAGAVETIFCILAIRDQIVPPTLNLDNPDEGTEGVDLVPKVAKKRTVRAALNNSFGFGGTNASVIVKAVD